MPIEQAEQMYTALKKRDIEETFRQIFRKDLDQIEQHWKRYILNLKA